jgi:hypothetical protein
METERNERVEPRCGTCYKYAFFKCRCDLCRKAKKEAKWKARAKQLGIPVWDPSMDPRLHGGRNDPEYSVWADYGGRGIEVCDRWRNSYPTFLADMGQRPTPDHSIERIDNNGNYAPENCRWATRIEQSNNRRSNRHLTFQGRTQTLAQWEREIGGKGYLIKQRLKLGWSVDRALTTPAPRRG